ncbi:MAG: DUF4176 domain-containing protein [Bacilli bacterium]|nr:DUF4176 domain-containing protein [Clostridia bacterium]MBR4693400.1 DUF4176 domain-containing protein [Bacilli bacterium]MBR6137741.1 DUF4176 domain-containing protein [Bacilli bacterium]
MIDKEKYLPVGTVVLLKGGNKRVMITSYLIFSAGEEKDKKMYDYGGCRYPEGLIDSSTGIGFNHEDIEKIIHLGLEDDEEYKTLNDSLKQYGETLKEEFLKTISGE